MFTAVLVELFALLTIACWVLVAAAVTVPAIRSWARVHALGIASAVTGTATLGSIYLSEVARWIPCELCWVQRIFAYSLATILGVELIRRLRGRTPADVWPSAVALALPGLAVSAWHVVIQRLPSAGTSCDPDIPCSAVWMMKYGVVTVPVMAGTAFLVVLAMALVSRRAASDQIDAEGTPRDAEPTPGAHEHVN